MSTLLFVGFTAGIYLTRGSVPQNLLVLDGLSAFFEFMLSYPYYYLAIYLTLGAVGSYHLLKPLYTEFKKEEAEETEEGGEAEEVEEEEEETEEAEEAEEAEVAERGDETEEDTSVEIVSEDMDIDDDMPPLLPPSPTEIYTPLFEIINA